MPNKNDKRTALLMIEVRESGVYLSLHGEHKEIAYGLSNAMTESESLIRIIRDATEAYVIHAEHLKILEHLLARNN